MMIMYRLTLSFENIIDNTEYTLKVIQTLMVTHIIDQLLKSQQDL